MRSLGREDRRKDLKEEIVSRPGEIDGCERAINSRQSMRMRGGMTIEQRSKKSERGRVGGGGATSEAPGSQMRQEAGLYNKRGA